MHFWCSRPLCSCILRLLKKSSFTFGVRSVKNCCEKGTLKILTTPNPYIVWNCPLSPQKKLYSMNEIEDVKLTCLAFCTRIRPGIWAWLVFPSAWWFPPTAHRRQPRPGGNCRWHASAHYGHQTPPSAPHSRCAHFLYLSGFLLVRTRGVAQGANNNQIGAFSTNVQSRLASIVHDIVLGNHAAWRGTPGSLFISL